MSWAFQPLLPSAAVAGQRIGTLAVTEGADTAGGTGKVTVKGTLAVTEGADALTSTVDVIIRGILHHTDTDTLTATGTAPRSIGVLGKVMVQTDAFQTDTFQHLDDTEPGDTLSAAGSVYTRATLAVTEAADTLSASGTVAWGAITGTLAVTEGADTAGGIATVLVRGTLSVTEAADTGAGSGDVIATGTGTATEAADTASAAGKVIVTGAGAATEAADALSASGILVVPRVGTLDVTEAADGTNQGLFQTDAFQNDTFQHLDAGPIGMGAVLVKGTLAVTEGADTLYAVVPGDAFQPNAFDPGGFQTTELHYSFTDAFQSDAFEALGGTTVTQPTDAVLTGTISLEGAFSRIIDVSANLSGSGSITAPATINQPAFSGAFQLDAFQATTDRPYEYDRASDGLSGFVRLQGLFDVGGVEKAVSATLSGRGSLTVLPDLESLPPMRLEGTGYITATANIIHARGSYLSGRGNLTASAGRVFDVGEVTLSGAGSLVGTVGNMLETEAELSGTGSLSVIEVERVRNVGAVLLRGSGLIAAAAVNGAIHMGASLSGTGSLTADLDQTHARSSNLSGHGSLTASAGVIREVSARLAGSGSMSVVARKTNKKTYPAVLLIGV